MPRKAGWLKRIPDIIRELKALPSPHLDLAVIAKSFGVTRRQALNLAHQLGLPPAQKRYRRAYIIERSDLIAAISTRKLHRAAAAERLRVSGLAERLAEIRRDFVARRVPVRLAQVRERTLAELPATIRLQRGELRMTFKDSQDFLQQIYTLARVAGHDFEALMLLLDAPSANEPKRTFLRGISAASIYDNVGPWDPPETPQNSPGGGTGS
jgi:hypothetical protein